MEGERRKRKLENEEENDEEQKMEKFFALIKSTKDVRDLLSKEKKVDDEKAKGIWTPMFQPEDFIDYGKFGRSNMKSTPHAGSSEKEKEVMIEKDYLQEATTAAVPVAPAAKTEDKENASNHLDLNLSL